MQWNGPSVDSFIGGERRRKDLHFKRLGEIKYTARAYLAEVVFCENAVEQRCIGLYEHKRVHWFVVDCLEFWENEFTELILLEEIVFYNVVCKFEEWNIFIARKVDIRASKWKSFRHNYYVVPTVQVVFVIFLLFFKQLSKIEYILNIT